MVQVNIFAAQDQLKMAKHSLYKDCGPSVNKPLDGAKTLVANLFPLPPFFSLLEILAVLC